MCRMLIAKKIQPKISSTPPNGVAIAKAVLFVKQSKYKLPLNRTVPDKKNSAEVFKYFGFIH